MTTAPEILRDRNAHALIVFRIGRTKLHALALHQPPVRVVKLEKAERRDLVPLLHKGKPYPLPRAVRLFKRAGRALGITDKARRTLDELRQAGA